MVTIRYFDGNKHIHVEVSEDFAKAFQQMEKEDALTERKETRRHESLDELISKGYEFVQEEPEENEWMQEMLKKLPEALKQLTDEQLWLIEQVFYFNRSQLEISKELGVSHQAITRRLERILKKLKKFLD